MKKLLVAVDETSGAQAIISVLKNQVRAPQEVVLVHVQRILGRSLMGGMLGEAEMSTLRESLIGTEHQEALDAKAEKVIAYYSKELAGIGLMAIRPVIRSGNPAEEILKVAREENVDLMILGCNGKSMMEKMVSGSVTRDIERQVQVPVLVARPETAGYGKTSEANAARLQGAYAMEGDK
jgi:nucleotide-binding universal stress UspA family protein